MISKILKSTAFKSIISKLIVLYIVYVKKISILNLFAFSVNFPSNAIIACDIAILTFIFDYILLLFLKKYIYVYIGLKNAVTGENSTIFKREIYEVSKVILNVTVKSQSMGVLRLIKKYIGDGRIIVKIKWSYDTWLSFARVDGILTMDKFKNFYAETDCICVNLLEPISEEENYASIINTPLRMGCDMGDKSEGLVILEIVNDINNPFKKRIIEILESIWFDVNYIKHKVKVV